MSAEESVLGESVLVEGALTGDEFNPD